MRKLLLFSLLLGSLIFFNSCSQKIYLQEADKLEYNVDYESDIKVNAYFAGDALDYLVFELDVFNESELPVTVDYRDVSLRIQTHGKRDDIILRALDKNRVLDDLALAHRELERERKARNVENAVNIGLSVLGLGLGQGANALDVLIYSTDTAAYLLEDARAYRLMKGSLEEQRAYVNEWVLGTSTVEADSDNSFDVLFERELIDAPADFVIEIDNQRFKVPFKLHILEQKVR